MYATDCTWMKFCVVTNFECECRKKAFTLKRSNTGRNEKWKVIILGYNLSSHQQNSRLLWRHFFQQFAWICWATAQCPHNAATGNQWLKLKRLWKIKATTYSVILKVGFFITCYTTHNFCSWVSFRLLCDCQMRCYQLQLSSV